jgi:DNA-binding response OmpR family regulator
VTTSLPSSLIRDVLVVEDQGHIARLLEFMLQREGFTVDVACDGAIAEQMISATPYSAVLLNLDLADCTGLEVLRFVRSSKLQNRPAVIVLSALCTGEISHQAMAAGADAYYPQPFSPAALLSRMRELGVTKHRAGIGVCDDFR